MYSGVRLSQLAVGEPLLNVNWEYKELKGKAAVAKRFEDVIYNASYLGFTYLIDTVRPQVDESGNAANLNGNLETPPYQTESVVFTYPFAFGIIITPPFFN